MGFFSSKSGTNSTGTTFSDTIPEQWAQTAGQANYYRGENAVNNWNPVLAPELAGFTPDQLAAQAMLRQGSPNYAFGGANQAGEDARAAYARLASVGTPGGVQAPTVGTYTYNPYTTSDARMAQLQAPLTDFLANMQSAQQLVGGAPVQTHGYGASGAGAVQAQGVPDVIAQQIAAARIARGDIRDVTAGYSPDELQRYLASIDPQYAQAVLDPALADIERNRQMVQQQNMSAAAKAGAFGGSRHGVTEAETNRAYADQVARTTGDIRMKGFDEAVNMLQQDFARRLAADQGNQGMDWNTASGNANLLQQANIANQGADLSAQQGNQGTRAQINIANANNGTQAAISSAGFANQAAAAQAAAQNQAALQYQSLLAQAGLANQNTRYGVAGQLAGNNVGMEGNNGLALNNAGQFNAGQLYNRDVANMGQFNANQATNAAGAAGLAGLNQSLTDTGLRQYGALAASGQGQQDFLNAQNQLGYQNDLTMNQAELARIAMLQQLLANTNVGTQTTTNSSGTTNSTQSPSTFSNLMSVAGPLLMSDERLKKNIKPMSGPLAAIHRMKGVTYDWKGGGPDAGLLAQDVEAAIPGAIDESRGAKAYSVPKVLGLLTESVKELDRKVSRKRKA